MRMMADGVIIKIAIFLCILCQLTYAEAHIKISQLLINSAYKAGVGGIGDPCNEESGCYIYDTECYNGVCRCRNQYKPWDGSCVLPSKRLDEPCRSGGDCLGLFSECNDGFCGCKEGSVKQNGECKQACTGCAEENECSLPYSDCNSAVCECIYGFTLRNGFCQEIGQDPGELGGICSTPSDCVGGNATCHNGRCQCAYLYTQVWNQCLQEKNNEEECVSYQQCPPNEYCDCDSRCVCKTGFLYHDVRTECVPKLQYGATCEYTVQCDYHNNECVDSKCGCTPEHGRSLLTKHCVAIKEATQADFPLDVPFNENFNNIESAEYASIQATVEAIIGAITDGLVADGVDVIDVRVNGFQADPDSPGTLLIISVEAYNSELDKSSISRRSAVVRRNDGASSNEQLDDSVLANVDDFVKKAEEQLKQQEMKDNGSAD